MKTPAVNVRLCPRTHPSHGRGRRFEPCTAHQENQRLVPPSGGFFVFSLKKLEESGCDANVLGLGALNLATAVISTPCLILLTSLSEESGVSHRSVGHVDKLGSRTFSLSRQSRNQTGNTITGIPMAR